MEDYRKSNYAINKVSKGIVYRNADGSILEITFEKIAENNPTFTKEDFERLKMLSDELYHEEEKGDNLQAHYIKSLFDENTYATLSLEEELVLEQSSEYYMKKIIEAINTTLTPTPKRRLKMSIFDGMTTREIAEKENCYRNAVWKSISDAKKKIKKYLKNFLK